MQRAAAGRGARRSSSSVCVSSLEAGAALRSCGDARALAAADLLRVAKRATRGLIGAPRGGPTVGGTQPIGIAPGAGGALALALRLALRCARR